MRDIEHRLRIYAIADDFVEELMQGFEDLPENGILTKGEYAAVVRNAFAAGFESAEEILLPQIPKGPT